MPPPMMKLSGCRTGATLAKSAKHDCPIVEQPATESILPLVGKSAYVVSCLFDVFLIELIERCEDFCVDSLAPILQIMMDEFFTLLSESPTQASNQP